MYKKIIILFSFLILAVFGCLYYCFFHMTYVETREMFQFSFDEYSDEYYKQCYKPYIKEVYARFISQESKYTESMGYPVKFKLKESNPFFSTHHSVEGFCISVEYPTTLYNSVYGSFHEYILTLERLSDFFEGELRLLWSLGVYPFVVPIDPAEEPSLYFLPTREDWNLAPKR